MVTAVPGPKSRTHIERLSTLTDASNVHFVPDMDRSVGNYVVDADGNSMLDCFAHIASLPIGYNHPTLRAAFADPANHAMMMHRPALGNLPPVGYAEEMESTLMGLAPRGLHHVTAMMCGSCANENAFKAAFIARATALRGGRGPSEEDLSSSLRNEAPGSPPLSILSFEQSFHGRLMGTLSASRSKAIHKVDVPAFSWPTAPWPKLRYPLAENEEENAAEEARCLDAVRSAMRGAAEQGRHVAALVVEPIQAEGGDNHASPAFFRALQTICAEHEALFMVDEVQTGVGATGRFWAHEHWNLPSPPDVVSFSKKMQLAGYFHGPELRQGKDYRIFNTWCGNPVELKKLTAIKTVIEAEGLVENTAVTGAHLLAGLTALAERHPGKVQNPRGQGTFCAFDVPTPQARDALLRTMRDAGVQIGGCGSHTVRFRPSLIFRPNHAEIALACVEDSLSALQ